MKEFCWQKKTVVETMEEVVRLRYEVLDLRNALNQRPRQSEEGNDGRDEGEQPDQPQVLPGGVSSEVLRSMAKDHQCVEDNYWHSSLMITIGSAEYRQAGSFKIFCWSSLTFVLQDAVFIIHQNYYFCLPKKLIPNNSFEFYLKQNHVQTFLHIVMSQTIDITLFRKNIKSKHC